MTTVSSSDSASSLAAAVMPKVPVTLDARGRGRTSPEQRRHILAEFERSGVSAARFAQRTGLKYSTLAGWLQRYRRAQRRVRTQPVRLLEAVAAPSTPTAALLVQLPGGARLQVREAGQIPLAVALLEALETPRERPATC